MLITLLFAGLLLPQAKPARPAPPSVPAAAEAADEYRIGPEDVLAIYVWQNEALSRTVAVRPDGRISLPLVNDVVAGGLTPTRLRQTLVQKYKEFDSAIELSVLVNEVNSFRVSLVGKVLRPERYRLRSPTTVLDLLAMGGGLAEYADAENIVILRTDPGARSRRIRFNYKRFVSSSSDIDNIALQPNDVVIVP